MPCETDENDETGADDLVARAQEAARRQERADLVKRLMDGGIMARMFSVACETADPKNLTFATMVNAWGATMIDAAKVLSEDA